MLGSLTDILIRDTHSHVLLGIGYPGARADKGQVWLPDRYIVILQVFLQSQFILSQSDAVCVSLAIASLV